MIRIEVETDKDLERDKEKKGAAGLTPGRGALRA